MKFFLTQKFPKGNKEAFERCDLLNVTDPEILKTEKFGSRDFEQMPALNRKLVLVGGVWQMKKIKRQGKGEKLNDKKRTNTALLP